jgi:hypothetical protein
VQQSKSQSSSIIETSKAVLESTEFGHSIHMSLQFLDTSMHNLTIKHQGFQGVKRQIGMGHQTSE